MSTYRLSVYEYNRDGEIHVGTQEELTEATGVAKGNLHLYSEKIGTRHIKLKTLICNIILNVVPEFISLKL